MSPALLEKEAYELIRKTAQLFPHADPADKPSLICQTLKKHRFATIQDQAIAECAIDLLTRKKTMEALR